MNRVLMTTDTVGGVWTYALELARALSRERVQTVLATMGEALTSEQAKEASQVPELIVRESTFRLEWMDDPWDDVTRAGEWILDLEREFEPDVVHLNGFVHGSLPFRAPKIVVAHSCVLSWWRAVRGEDAPENLREYERRVSRGLQRADHVVAPTQAMLTSMQSHYGPLFSASVIPNARALQQGPAQKEPFFFAAGRLWDEAKNVALLDRIAGQLPWPVFLAGGGYGAKHALAVGKLSRDETEYWLSRASIYAFPARYEPFGLSILEAALMGCALVLGDIPSLRENWEGVAEFVDPNDETAWLSSLKRLAGPSEEGRRLQMGAAARARALNFSPSRTAQAYLSLYRGCADSHALKSRAVLL